MAQHNLLETNTVALNDVFTNGRRYQVPIYQRDYSWKEEHWDDLWTDILSVYKKETRVHYMGAIVLQDLKEKNYSIIDGQQRLATLSIVALAVIKRIQYLIDLGIEVEENEERKKLYMGQFIGSKEGVSLRYSNKLKLNENNDSFYRSFLVQLREPINPQKLPSSNTLLQMAFEFFYEKICNSFGEKPKGKALADFLQNQLAEKLLFIQIVVENDLDAYTVFETLNARGIELSISDLLKNYLLSLTAQSEEDLHQAKEQWKSIIQITDLDKFPTFLRYFWHSRYETIRKEQLFKALRKVVTTKEDTFHLLDSLEKYAAVYSALKNPNDELWKGNKEIRKRVNELKLFGVTQPFPLLLEAYFKLPISQFEDVLRFCSVIAFRYNVIGNKDPKKQELAFHKASKKLFNKEITNSSQVAQELKSIYIDDEEFESLFSTKQVNTKSKKRLARYILYSLENQLVQNNPERNFEEETATIEHILPENPPLEWESSFSLEEQENYIYRLGNLTLLESSKNNDCGTKPFKEKQIIYQQSQYKMTKGIDYLEWKPSQIRSRQEKLAEIAKTVWKITQISN
jgi:uncharacterized protein with ParB-like and HNH nuclease domain